MAPIRIKTGVVNAYTKIVLQGNNMKLRKRIDWKNELNDIVTRNNGTSSRRPNAVSSYATQKKRRENLFSAFADLRTLGYKLESVRNIKTKHVRAVVRYWIKEGQSPSTVQNKIYFTRCIFRFLKTVENSGSSMFAFCF